MSTNADPKNLTPENTQTQFICLCFDDNGISEGLDWIDSTLDNYRHNDGTPLKATFFGTEKYIREKVYEPHDLITPRWRRLYGKGHEWGNHSSEHLLEWDEINQRCINHNGREYSEEEWFEKEISPCQKRLTAPYPEGLGLPESSIAGFRAPRLEWNNNLMSVLKREGFKYDCSMEDTTTDGAQTLWPHKLLSGSSLYPSVGSHDLWEVYNSSLFPPRDIAEKIGAEIIQGLDYTAMGPTDWGCYALSGDEFSQILCNTLDLKLNGNRAPFLVGLHSDVYSEIKNSEFPGTTSAKERQRSIESFIEYAFEKYGKSVKFTTISDMLESI